MMARRYLTAIPFAVAVAFGLFMLMQALISFSEAKVDDVKSFQMIDFVRVRRSSQFETKKRALPEKAQAQKAPEAPDMNLDSSAPAGGAVAVNVGAPTVDPSSLRLAGGPTLGAAPSDTDTVPLVRVNPKYPMVASERKIEGWVDVMFTINPNGTVKEAVVLDAQPPGVFEQAALQAIRKWKYKPKIENGVPVERPGVKVRLTFKLEDQQQG